MMKACEQRGRDLLNLNVITAVGLSEWLRAKETGHETISLGLPSYSLLYTLLQSIKAGAGGLLLGNVEVNQHNRPQDRLLDWFFQPVLVLKEQIQALKMAEEEVRFLEKLTLFVGDAASASGWDNGAVMPQDPVRLAQIQAISRRYVCLLPPDAVSSENQCLVYVSKKMLGLIDLCSLQYNPCMMLVCSRQFNISPCSNGDACMHWQTGWNREEPVQVPDVQEEVQARREAAHRVRHRA